MKGVLVMLAVASLCGCGGSGGSAAGPSNNGINTPPPAGGISVTNDAFSPAAKSIPVGTTLQWAWNSCTSGDPYNGTGATCVEHSVTFDDGSASSALQSQGSFSKTFNTPGTYTYHCQVHGTMGMTGTITVNQ